MGEESKTKIKDFFFSPHLSFQLLKLLPQAVPVAKTFKDRLVAYIDKDIRNYNSYYKIRKMSILWTVLISSGTCGAALCHRQVLHQVNQGQIEPGNSLIPSLPHLAEFSVDGKHRRKYFLMLKTSVIREGSTASHSLVVSACCTWADCSELKAGATSCPCKAHYC